MKRKSINFSKDQLKDAHRITNAQGARVWFYRGREFTSKRRLVFFIKFGNPKPVAVTINALKAEGGK